MQRPALDAVPEEVYTRLGVLWTTLPAEMRDLAQLYPCKDFLDPLPTRSPAVRSCT